MTDIIAAMLTPAVMINVCGLLLLSTANRNSRVIDRIRHINVELIRGNVSEEVCINYRKQLILFKRRSKILKNALMINYTALLLFIITSLSIFLSAYWELNPVITLVFLLSGFAALALFAGLLIREGSIHFETTALDMELAAFFTEQTDDGKDEREKS